MREAAATRGAFYIFAIITDGKHSKAIVRIAPTYLSLLVETSLVYTLFAYVAGQRVNFCLCGTQSTCTNSCQRGSKT
jgi:hypothetical protein